MTWLMISFKLRWSTKMMNLCPNRYWRHSKCCGFLFHQKWKVMCLTSSLGNTNFEANGECTKGKGTNKQGNHSTLGPTCETMHDPVTNMGPKSMLILKANKDQLAYANAYTNHYRAPMSGPTKMHNVKVSDSHITWALILMIPWRFYPHQLIWMEWTRPVTLLWSCKGYGHVRGCFFPLFYLVFVAMNSFSDVSLIAWNMCGAIGWDRKCHISQMVRIHKPFISLFF